MKKTLLITLVFVIQGLVYAQTPNSVGKTVTFSLKAFKDNALRATQSNGLVTKMTSKFPLPDGTLGDFIFDETLISTSKIADIQTLDGISVDGKIKIKITITDRMTGIMHTPEGYFFIEPIDAKADLYIIYHMSETSVDNMKCGVLDHSTGDFIKQNKNSIKSISPFPIGTQLRKYRMAAAATGEFVTFYGSQATALARIVDVMNATNLIYELEASIRFELITATTNYTILFTNAGTDPFTPNTDFASSAASRRDS